MNVLLHEILSYVFPEFFCRNASFSVFYQIKEALVRELSEKFCSQIDSLRQEVRVSVVMYTLFIRLAGAIVPKFLPFNDTLGPVDCRQSLSFFKDGGWRARAFLAFGYFLSRHLKFEC